MTKVYKDKTLNLLLPGKKAVIKSFDDLDLASKMQELGCIPGESITLERIAPLGDPILIRIDNSLISLRKKEAEEIHVSLD